MFSFSARAMSSLEAPDERTPPPATMTGRCSLFQQFDRFFHARRLGFGPVGRKLLEVFFDDHLHLGLSDVELALVACELQVHGPRTTRGGDPESLADHVRKARDVIHRSVELRHRLEGGNVVHFLINLSELGLGHAPAREGQDGGFRQIGIPQARREVQRTDDLRHADAGLLARAGVAVRHVGGGFLAVRLDAGDVRAFFHLGHRAPENGGNQKSVSHAITLEHLGHDLGACHFRHSQFLLVKFKKNIAKAASSASAFYAIQAVRTGAGACPYPCEAPSSP